MAHALGKTVLGFAPVIILGRKVTDGLRQSVYGNVTGWRRPLRSPADAFQLFHDEVEGISNVVMGRTRTQAGRRQEVAPKSPIGTTRAPEVAPVADAFIDYGIDFAIDGAEQFQEFLVISNPGIPRLEVKYLGTTLPEM